MAGKEWTMNCVLLGAKVGKLMEEGKVEEAREQLTDLTSELSVPDVIYLLRRVQEGR